MGFNPSGGKIANATDVAIGAHATVGDGQALSYNSADQLWENRVGATTFNVRNYGALGNTKQVIGSINSGSHTLTITQSVFTSGDVGKAITVYGAGVSATVVMGVPTAITPLTTTISGYTSSTVVTLAAAATTTVSNPGTTNVNYGTDDSTAIAAARDDLIAKIASYPNSQYQMTGTLYFPQGIYMVTQQDCLMYTPSVGSPSTGQQLLRGLTIEGASMRSTQIVFASAVTGNSDPTQGNLMSLGNRVRGMRVRTISFYSTNPYQSVAYMWCSSANDNSEEGQYGSGSQNDVVWHEVMLSGIWQRWAGFDGDGAANQNSEQRWEYCQITNDAGFYDSVIRSGFTPFHSQQDQFLNYLFVSCAFEYGIGNFFTADKGGFIQVLGGSFINGITTGLQDGTPGGVWFQMGDYTHFDDVMHLTVIATRFEFWSSTGSCELIDSYWGGNNSHIYFQGITVATNHVSSPSTMLLAAFHGDSANGIVQGMVKFDNCQLPGYVLMDYTSSTAAGNGRVVFELCNFRNYSSVTGISTNSGFLRYTAGATPKYRFTNCAGITSDPLSN
jgi:hypothetical protein